MKILTPAERRALKARAHHLAPVVMIGDAGLTPQVLHEIDVNLKSHDLIKIRVLGDDRDARAALIDTVCSELQAAPVQHIGKILVIFRPRPEDQLSAPGKARKTAGNTGFAARPRSKKAPHRTKRSFQNKI